MKMLTRIFTAPPMAFMRFVCSYFCLLPFFVLYRLVLSTFRRVVVIGTKALLLGMTFGENRVLTR